MPSDLRDEDERDRREWARTMGGDPSRYAPYGERLTSVEGDVRHLTTSVTALSKAFEDFAAERRRATEDITKRLASLENDRLFRKWLWLQVLGLGSIIATIWTIIGDFIKAALLRGGTG